MASHTRPATFPDANAADSARSVGAAVAGGVVGTTLMALVLLVVQAATGELPLYRTVAELTVAGEDPFVGAVAFFVAGSVVWPLVFATVGVYLPGRTRVRQALAFALALWVGFSVAFGNQYVGTALATFVAYGLVSHVLYGLVLGSVYARLTGAMETPELPV